MGKSDNFNKVFSSKYIYIYIAISSAFAYQSEQALIKPDLSYLNNYERQNRYEDSLDIIDGEGIRYFSCNIELGTETKEENCATDYTGTVKYKRNVYGSGAATNLEECKSTRKTYSNWTESANNCVYTPVCSEEYQEKVKLSCPAGQEGEIVKTIRHRSKHYGKRVEVSVCNDYDTTESTENTCRTIIPPVYNPDEIEPVPHCNDKVAVNGETGKWIRFKRGGLPFWAPFYTKYIEENGMQKFYEKVFNAKNDNNLESIFQVDNGKNSCITLKDEFKNENAIENYTTIGNAKLDGIELYANASFDLDIKMEGNIKFTKPLTLTSNRINIDNVRGYPYEIFNFANYYGQPSNLRVNNLTVNNARNLFCGNVNVNADTINLTTDEKNVENNLSCKDAQTLVLNVNTINAPEFNYEKKWNLDTDKRNYNINAKEVRLKTIITPKNFSKENPNVGEWNIEHLILSKGAVMPGHIKFTGKIETNGELVNYGNINGDVCVRTNDYFVNFGQHSGNSTCNGKGDALDLIPHEYCNNNIAVNGQRGKWVKFRYGSAGFWQPLYEDFIAKNGKNALFNKIYNGFELNTIESFFRQYNKGNAQEIGDLSIKTNADDSVCITLDKDIRSGDKLTFTSIGNDRYYFNIWKDANYDLDLKITSMGFNVKNRNEIWFDYNAVKLTSNNINIKTDAGVNDYLFKNPNIQASTININVENSSGKSKNHMISYYKAIITANTMNIQNDSNINEIMAGYTWQDQIGLVDLNIGNLNAPNLTLGGKHLIGEIYRMNIRNANIKDFLFTKKYNENFVKSNISIDNLSISNEFELPGNFTFNGNITTTAGDVNNYGIINGDICIKQNDKYLINFGTHNGRNVCVDNDAMAFVPNAYCNDRLAVNGETGQWVNFKSGSKAIWKPFYTDYITKNGRPKFFDMVLNYDELKNADLEFGEANEVKKIECIMMDNRFKADELVSISKIGNTSIPIVRVPKDAKYNLDVTTRTVNLMNKSKLKGDSLNANIININTGYDSAFINANLDMTGDIHINVLMPETKRGYQNFALFGSSHPFDETFDVLSIKARNLFITKNNKNAYFRTISRIDDNPLRLDINIENELSMPDIIFNNNRFHITDNRNPIFNLKARLIKLKKLDFPMQYYTNLPKSKWEFEEMRADEDINIPGNINMFGNIKTNNKVRLYGYLKGDIYTKQADSVIDIFGRHEGRIFGNDIGYETE